MSKTNSNPFIPARCMECSFIGYSRKLEYYPVYYCKLNGEEVRFNSENGYERMEWCPLDKEEKKDA